MKLKITISIETIDFDTEGCKLRVSGVNIKENKYIKLGQYHTVEIAPYRNFTIWKDNWDSIHLQRINMACDPSNTAEIAAVLMQSGLANICLVTKHMSLVKAKIQTKIPKKRSIGNAHNKAKRRFFDAIIEGLQRHIKYDVVKVIIIASPGFLKDDFKKYLDEKMMKDDIKVLLDNKNKFLLTYSANGFKHSLADILTDPVVINRINETKSINEVQILKEFYHLLNVAPDKAFYGMKHVQYANEQIAIKTLLISDSLFRSKDIQTRQKYVSLVELCKDNGATICIFSALHVSGQQLIQLGGIAAILRFPLPNIEQLQNDEDDIDSDSFSPGSTEPDDY